MNDNNKISETSLAAAYQVTSRYFVNEEQLIWRRTSFFVTLQSLVAAAIYYFRADLHVSLSIILPALGIIYSIFWHFSMNRAWAYQKFIIRMMREQEEALKLGKLGIFSRGKSVVEGGEGEHVAGELTRFPASIVIFRAKVLADLTTWLFVVVYFVLFIIGLSNVNFSG
jgi:hypothetical protein